MKTKRKTKSGTNKIKVLMIEPWNVPYETEIEPNHEAMKNALGGYIDAIYPWDDLVAVIVI